MNSCNENASDTIRSSRGSKYNVNVTTCNRKVAFEKVGWLLHFEEEVGDLRVSLEIKFKEILCNKLCTRMYKLI